MFRNFILLSRNHNIFVLPAGNFPRVQGRGIRRDVRYGISRLTKLLLLSDARFYSVAARAPSTRDAPHRISTPVIYPSTYLTNFDVFIFDTIINDYI